MAVSKQTFFEHVFNATQVLILILTSRTSNLLIFLQTPNTSLDALVNYDGNKDAAQFIEVSFMSSISSLVIVRIRVESN